MHKMKFLILFKTLTITNSYTFNTFPNKGSNSTLESKDDVQNEMQVRSHKSLLYKTYEI